jgi:hypothetical protein
MKKPPEGGKANVGNGALEEDVLVSVIAATI